MCLFVSSKERRCILSVSHTRRSSPHILPLLLSCHAPTCIIQTRLRFCSHVQTQHQGLHKARIQLADPKANGRIVFSPHVYGPSVFMQEYFKTKVCGRS